MGSSYDASLNLPKTKFAMRGNLPNKEPAFFEQLEKEKIYYKLMQKNSDSNLFVLHDGPPYANGDIHLGTALNKILKDFIVRQKNMCGYKAPFVPGWDTHGLPIELKALKECGKDRAKLGKIELRNLCRSYAVKYINIQREQFKSLGVIGDFSNPYLTFNKEFEAEQIKVFGEMLEKGYIYKGLKPVYYCCKCKTALAESEIEYENDECFSLYVKFRVSEDFGFFEKIGLKKQNVYFVIWTTTAWTLPANVAICLSVKFEYSVVKYKDEYYVMAKDLVHSSVQSANIEDFEVVGEFSGKDFENMKVRHPFIDRESLIVVGDHVTLESGTGCVHTAPGHGVEDFEVCRNYKDIPIKVVVDENGRLNEEAFEFSGLTLQEANVKILDKLQSLGYLFAVKKIEHKYPHCWRCKEPVLFRATEQWFCSVQGFKEAALNAIKGVKWIPSWGENRIVNMVQGRSDWCISRQRVWGVPIPIFYCSSCKKYVVDEVLIDRIAKMFEVYGSNCWFEKEPEDFLPSNFSCSYCGGKKFFKETDIMDVWFDSGCSHFSVLTANNGLRWPADLYLEGADQYRGWFQSSLLTAVATKNESPYRSVCTHGWVVDGEGRKMSKSLANGVAPEKIIKEYGADILRLWVASSDYHSDIRISNDILKQLSDAYKKIRNTARFILGNISDFNPNTDIVDFKNLRDIDLWAMVKLNELIRNVKINYDEFRFFNIYHDIYNFCVVYMSNFYLDVIKDRLYCDIKNGEKRRAAQTTIYIILDALTRMLAPILAFTSEEIWSFMPHRDCDALESVLLNNMYDEVNIEYDSDFLKRWDAIFSVRDVVKKALEEERKNKVIGSSLEAGLVLHCSDYYIYNSLKCSQDILSSVFLVSEVSVLKADAGQSSNVYGVVVDVKKPGGSKCERCWNYSDTVGANEKHANLCERCSFVVENM